MITPSLIPALTAVPGLSGHEDAIARVMADHLAPLVNDVTIDALGNVIARMGPARPPRIVVAAHIDTVGFLVKQVRAGMIGVVSVGGVNLKALPGSPVQIGPGIPGMITVRSQHLASPGEHITTIEDIFIQVDPAALDQVEITQPVLYASQPVELGEHLYCSPYLDNRAGCAVMLALAQTLYEQPPANEVILIGTVQEETTCMGAYHALAAVQPDAALFVDGTLAYDTPETQGRGPVRLGAGPVLTAFLYMSSLTGWHAHPGLRAHLKHIAQQYGIPVQQDAIRGLMNDVRAALPLGIPSALIGLPVCGKHAPLETVHMGDLELATRLLAATLQSPLPSLSRG